MSFQSTPPAYKWYATPSGEISGRGVYSPGGMIPDGGVATITAKGSDGSRANAMVQVSVLREGTPAFSLPHVNAETLYEHTAAASGARLYLSGHGAGSTKILLQRSDDGGRTMGASVPLPIEDASPSGTCLSIAVDPANPDRLYLAYPSTSFKGLALFTSNDGGKTGTTLPLTSSSAPSVGAERCPSIAAHAPGSVLVLATLSKTDASSTDLTLTSWFDGQAGATLGPLAQDPEAASRKVSSSAHANQDGSGGTRFAQDLHASPRVATNGRGLSCVTYQAEGRAAGTPTWGVWVQCTTDGVHFGAPSLVASATENSLALPSLDVAEDGTVTVAFHAQPPGAESLTPTIRQSRDHGTSWDAPREVPLPFGKASLPLHLHSTQTALWFAYGVGESESAHTVVGKSCDGGRTWGDAVALWGSPPKAPPLDLPFLVVGGQIATIAGYRGEDGILALPLE